MDINSSTQAQLRNPSLFVAFLLFIALILIFVVLSWMFSPSPLLFSEAFDNNEGNRQYTVCAAFTIVNERLRVTVTQPHSGCAIRFPEDYEDFTLTANVYPVDDVHDGSINILVRQGSSGWYEIQFRPKVQQAKFINFAVDANGNPYMVDPTDWKPVSGVIFKETGNTIKVTVTEQWLGFWFNDSLVFTATSNAEFPFSHGMVSIGTGAGETGGIAFEYDNLQIREERGFSRRWRDLWTNWTYKNPQFKTD